MVHDEVERLGQHFFENFFSFTKEVPIKRLQKTENDLIQSLNLRYEYSKIGIEEEKSGGDGMPRPRCLIGQRTNLAPDALSNSETRLQ